MTKPVDLLVSEEHRRKYGAFYAELKESRTALSTTLFHTVRCGILIALLVGLTNYPRAQASVYVASALASMVWDAYLLPYESRLTAADVLLLDAAKVAGGIGFVILTTISPGSDAFADWICTYELILFVSSIGAGLAMAVAQQIMGVVGTIREWCGQGKEGDKVFPLPARSMSTEFTQNGINFQAN